MRILFAISLLLIPPQAIAQNDYGDVAAGRDFADRICAECHAVQPGRDSSPYPAASPFQDIADTRSMTAMALQAWLTTSHPTMPNFIIEANDMRDIIAYILSLREE